MKLIYHLNERLKEKNLTKQYLQKKLNISSRTMAKFNKNESVSLTTIALICNELGCKIEDIVEIEKEVSTFLSNLLEEKKIKLPNGLYHELQILFAYNSNRIEGSKLNEEDTRYIYETNTIEGVKNTNDIIEIVNHFKAFDYLLDSIFEPLSETIIKQFHFILKNSTSDSRLEWFNVGDYKKRKNTVGGIDTTAPKKVSTEIRKLIDEYSTIDNKILEDIVDFHYQFEKIHPFQDGNGRVSRLIMFRECLKNNIKPFIIEDEIKFFYYRGLKEYPRQKGYLIDTCKSSQDRMDYLLNKFSY
jgi:Fic family protein